ncbi:MAG: DNA translocase FtsK 4TM domain-containing protein, partial [Burkholderiales bacterium]
MKEDRAPLPGKIANLLRESRWFLLIAGALYLALILLTFDRGDPSWSHATSAVQIQNAGGRVGAWLADVLLYLFGLSAYWWVVFFAYAVFWGYRRLDCSSLSDRRPFIIALLGFALLLAASSGLETLRLYSIKATLPLAPGGMIGALVSQWLIVVMGFTGATLVLLTLIAIGLSLFTGVSWLTFLEVVGAAIEWSYVFAMDRLAARRDRKVGEIAAEQREAVVEEKREQLIEVHEPIRIAPPVVDIPKSPRVQKEKQAHLFQDLPDTPLPPLKLLDEAGAHVETLSAETLEYTSRLIEKKLGDFGVQVKVLAAYPGPVITRYEIEPATGVKGSQILNLAKDLARALSVISIRVVETIPGKSC